MRIILGIVAIILIIWGLVALTRDNDESQNGDDSLARYFQEEMMTRGVADIGQPIEGFDAFLLMQAYPGLAIADFKGVQTIEGRYDVSGNEITFVRDETQPVTSAEQMLSEVGYGTLLDNVSKRLSMPAKTESDVNALIQKIDTGQRIQISLNQEGNVFGIGLTPLSVLEDSRCPQDVTCIQAGTVRVRTRIVNGIGVASQDFELNKPVIIASHEITLTQVEPPKASDATINNSDYLFHFQIIERGSGTTTATTTVNKDKNSAPLNYSIRSNGKAI